MAIAEVQQIADGLLKSQTTTRNGIAFEEFSIAKKKLILVEGTNTFALAVV